MGAFRRSPLRGGKVPNDPQTFEPWIPDVLARAVHPHTGVLQSLPFAFTFHLFSLRIHSPVGKITTKSLGGRSPQNERPFSIALAAGERSQG